jgi:uncharacterized protein YdaU (DUF1376 family)
LGSSPAFQFYADDYLVGTMTMTLPEKGAYMDCLAYQWSVGAVPGDDPKALARVMRCTTAEAKRVWLIVSSKFVRDEDGGWRNRRLEKERDKQAAYRYSRIESGRKGGLARGKVTSSSPTVVDVSFATANTLAKPSSPSPSPSPVPPSKNEGGERAPRGGLIVSPKTWGLNHGTCVTGFCDWLCLPAEDFGRFANRLGGEDKAMAWAKSVRNTPGLVPTGKPWAFWNAQFDAAHGTAAPASGGFSAADWAAHMPGGAIDKKLGIS